MIKRLLLQHWKSHEKTELKFNEGANLLVGGMGSGKSSCVDAICFALFGTFPALKSRRVSLQEVIKRKKDFCRVELEFESEGKNYIVSRSFGKNQKSELRVDQTVVETQSQRITEFIEKTLEIDYDLFTKAVYSEQNKIDYFLDLQRGERKKQFDNLIGISAFETVRANASTLINKLKSLKSELGFFNRSEYEELKKKLEFESNELKEIQKKMEEKERKQQNLLNSIEKLKTKIEELKNKKQVYLKALEDKTSISSQLSFIEKKLESKPELQKKLGSLEFEKTEVEKLKKLIERKRSLENQLSGLNAELNSFKKEELDETAIEKLESIEKTKIEVENLVEKLSAELAKTREKNNSKLVEALKIKKELEKIESEKPELEKLKKEIAFKTRELNENQKKEILLNEKIAQNNEIIELLNKAVGVCPTCGAELTEKHRVETLESKKSEVEKLKENLGKLNIEAEKNELKKLEERETRLESDCLLEEEKKALLKSISSEVSKEAEKKLEVMIEEERKKLSTLNEQVKLLSEQKFKLERQKLEEKKFQINIEKKKLVESELETLKTVDVNELKNKIERLNELVEFNTLTIEKKEKLETLKTIEDKLSQLGFKEQELIETENELSKIKEESAESKGSVEELKQRINSQKRIIEEFKKQLNAMEEKIKKIDEIETKIQKASTFEALILEVQTQLREELIQAINEVLEIVWKNIYPYRDYSSITVIPTENDYELKLKNEVLIDASQASGGERACAAIALRIALAVTMVPNLKWLILDEPTHNLDSNAVSMLSNAFREGGFNSITKQVFIITHDETLKSDFDSYYLFDRRKDDDGSTVVEKIKNI
jgi:exonuclease SbcC